MMCNNLFQKEKISIFSQNHLFHGCFCFCGPQHSGVNSSDTQVLTLNNITEEEGGEYICRVSNYIGEANQSAWLTVIKHEAPGKPPSWAGAGAHAVLYRGLGFPVSWFFYHWVLLTLCHGTSQQT